MARVRFLEDYDYKPTDLVTVAYLAGMEETVRRDCADKAIAAARRWQFRRRSGGVPMATTRSAGDLVQRVAFDRRADIDQGDGVMVGAWEEQFVARAGYIPLRAGETVIANRLQGRTSRVVFIRSSQQSRLITTDWRARDTRTGETMNVREVTLSTDRQWVELLCEGGVADG